MLSRLATVWRRLSEPCEQGPTEGEWSAELTWELPPPRSTLPGSHFTFRVRIGNAGTEVWPATVSGAEGAVMLGGVFMRDGEPCGYMGGWAELDAPLAPGREAVIEIQTNTEELAAGSYKLNIDMVRTGVGFFHEWGSEPLLWDIEIREPLASEDLWKRALRSCTNLYTISQGVHHGRDGAYPLFTAQTEGARLTDISGRTFLDYIMGWGTATLGYRRPEVEEAVREQLGTGPTTPFPHPLQVEAAERLCGILPCAERVLFGKNGSDVLEAAVRIARAHAGRDIVLCCGYHGFHDWYVASIDGIAGIPAALRELTVAFPYGDLDAVRGLLDQHVNRVAAVVIEPCSMAYPPSGYLETLREWTQAEGIVLIFDEIMSGFRLANAGAQQVFGVSPDMVTVGKGIANGLPLAALAGPHRIMDTAFKIGYGPTFHGEVYALAACCAALNVFETEAVCDHLCALGQALKLGLEGLAKEYEIPLTLSGILPRQVLMFGDAGESSAQLARTYFLQELLEESIICAGTFIPSYAHTGRDIHATLHAVEAIFARMRDALDRRALSEEIHIPHHTLYLGEDSKHGSR